MLHRRTHGSVVCRSCGLLVGVNDTTCFHCNSPYPSLWGFSTALRALGNDMGFTKIVIASCSLLYLVALVLDPSGIQGGGLFRMLSPSPKSSIILGASGAFPVFYMERWWTLLSAGWLHGSLLHIAFNLMWVRQLAPITAEIYGPGRTIIIYTFASVLGFTASSFGSLVIGGGGYTLGASAAIFGLLGALTYSARRGIASHISRQARTYAVILFVFGFLVDGIDNWAHAGGFVGGFLTAGFFNPLIPERLNHLAVALICVVLTLGSILLSFLTGISEI